MTLREFELFTLAAAIAAMWSQIRAWLAWPVSLLVVRRRIDAYSSGPVLSYLQANARWRPRGGNHYSSERPIVRPLGRVYRVWYEALKEAKQVFWLRRRPIWYAPVILGPEVAPGQPRETTIGMFFYLRGTLDWERLLAWVAAWEDERDRELHEGARHRFDVRYHGRSQGDASNSNPPPVNRTVEAISKPGYGTRILHWQPSDLVDRPPLSLDHLSLRPELVTVAARVRHWIDSKEWCEERGIPWRLGIALSGAPGTGKTSFARGLAVEHNMPVHVFDLASLDNYSFRGAWSSMLSDAPCMALIEDIDAVFHGREIAESVLKHGIPLTFDCLLNCISGVQAADGVLLVVTTNRPETLDPALLRRGRLDLHVTVTGLDAAGRRKMVDRILRDDPDAARIAEDPALAHLTPADLQEHLIQIALARRFGEAA